jgi:multiple sugar transport system permease protein
MTNTVMTTGSGGDTAQGKMELPVRGRRIPEHYWGYILLTPALVLVLGLILYPVSYSFYLSFFSKHAFFPAETFIGFENYMRFLTDTEDFWRSVKLGAIYAFSTVILQVIVGVAASLLLNETFIGRTLVRGVVLFPYMVPTIVVVILMRWILSDSFGILNYLLQVVGLIDRPIVWLGAENIMLVLILISTWTYFPFVLIGTLARLQTIDPELYAAAKVDGAGLFRRFFHVTLPQIRNVLFVLILLRFLFMFTKFDIVWLLTGGSGLGYYVRTLPIFTYMKAFGEMQVGAGAALSVIMFLILVAFALIYAKVFRREEEQ